MLLERAVTLDPDFAQAYSHLGSAYANRLSLNLEPSYPGFADVERAARRALELDPLDGEARALLATILYRVELRWTEAEVLFQESLRLAPNSTLVHTSYAWALVFNGRFDEAMGHTRLAQSLDPLNLGLRANNAAIAMNAHRFEQALHEFTSVLQIDPDHLFSRVVASVTCLAMGDPDAAMAHLDHIAGLVPDHFSPRFCRVCVFGMRGRLDPRARDEGERALASLLAEIGDRHYSRVNLAMAQVCLDDLDGAFASLDLAADAREVLFVCIRVHPLFEPLRRDARYLELLGRRGLEPLPPDVVTTPSQAPATLM